MRLIDADALKEEVKTNKVTGRFFNSTLLLIDNAPTVETASDNDIKGAYETGYKMGSYKMKDLIIHSIKEQYSAHNELVPIWLSIGDIKNDAVKPCENCDLYFKAMTKEVNNVRLPELYQGCLSCDAHNRCHDAFCSNAVNCNSYGKGGAE